MHKNLHVRKLKLKLKKKSNLIIRNRKIISIQSKFGDPQYTYLLFQLLEAYTYTTGYEKFKLDPF